MNEKAAVLLATIVADVIRELGEVPSGHLYARVMGHMSLQTYETLIGTLKRAHLISETNHVLRWIGPAKQPA